MDAKLLTRIRPKDDTAGALRAALDRIAEERDATTARVAALRSSRTASLLTGTPKQVLDLETEAREAGVVLEQLDLLEADLQPKHTEAAARERHAAFAAEAEEMLDKTEKARAWWREEYPRLAREIAAGLQRCRDAENGANALHHAYGQACNRDAALAALPSPLGTYPAMPRAYAAGDHFPPSQCVQLPPAAGEYDAIWWPRSLRGRPHPTGA